MDRLVSRRLGYFLPLRFLSLMHSASTFVSKTAYQKEVKASHALHCGPWPEPGPEARDRRHNVTALVRQTQANLRMLLQGDSYSGDTWHYLPPYP